MEAAEKHEGSQIHVKTRKIQQSGNSLCVTIPREIVKKMDLKAGEEVVVASKGDTIRMFLIKDDNVEGRGANESKEKADPQ